ncbi:MAG: protein-disulfide reductase DsbD [Phyllobacterium sp.]
MSPRSVLWLLARIFILLWPVVASAQGVTPLTPEKAFRIAVERGQDNGISLRWDIAEGYYLYRDYLQARDARTGEAISLRSEPGIVEANDGNFGPSEVYYSQATAYLESGVPEQVTVTYQGCQKDSICYPPQTVTLDTRTLDLSEALVGFGISGPAAGSGAEPETGQFQVAPDAAGGGMVGSLLASGGVVWVIASFLAFGLLLAFTPCVLPMYPILSATLARQGETLTPRRGFILSSSYVLAMAVAFGLLGIVAAWSGQNLQIVLQSPYAVGAIAALFVVLAISMFGFFELQLPAAWTSRMVGIKTGQRGSAGGAAAMGFASALIVGPCVTAPLAAALLYIAQTGDAWLGASALFALGLGQGIPLIVFGTVGSRALPRSGAWMEQVKFAFGFVFLAAAIWMLSRIVSPQVTLFLWSALLLTVAVFIGVADRLETDAQAGPRLRKAAGLALSLGAVILAVGAASGGSDPLRPLEHFARGGTVKQETPELTFAQAKSTKDLKASFAATTGRPTLVYFTADWCVTCRTVEREVLSDSGVQAALAGFQRLKVDLTDLDDTNQGLMRDLAVVGPPTMILFDSMGVEKAGTRLVGDVTRQTLQASISQVE